MSFGSFTNSRNPVVEGVNQGMQTSMPRLNYMNALNRQTPYPVINKNSSMNNGGDTNSLGGNIFSNAADMYGLYNTMGGTTGGASGSGFMSGAEGAGGFGGGAAVYAGLIRGGLNGLGSFAQSGDYKDGLQGMFGVEDENQSDIMQAVNGTMNGASMGSSFGPWGAAIGGVLGLGSSFLDDF